ncbi:helix-turn-helix domain-containing protein [Maledivibacter halophilus]|uniref:Predicted transcriptional regulator with C-terminal CBS domains n=1 Tax=Maledivibacter halophilus TaxID=36842 RepID=A0A1T5L342_9FIRM|nr:helix-turn-helix domain-containing protein [Maledivibacter halophilus]SKC70476.1 Predicted transcriptional regulator with C-terminal CBS domains [Maledivibacter halophilus]
MPFVKVNVKEEINQMKKADPKFAEAYDAVKKEAELIRQAKKLRKELGVTQPEIAEISGMTQQMISRMEKLGNSPSLVNFIRYLDGAGLEIKIEKKSINDTQKSVSI